MRFGNVSHVFLIVAPQLEKQPQVNFNRITLAVIFSVYSEESSVHLNSTFFYLEAINKIIVYFHGIFCLQLPSPFSFLFPRGASSGRERCLFYFENEEMKVQSPPCWVLKAHGAEHIRETYLSRWSVRISGSEFTVSSSGILVSSRHIVETQQKFWVTYQREEETEITPLEIAGYFTNNTGSFTGQVCTGVLPPQWIHHGRHRSKLQTCLCEITWLWSIVWIKFRCRSEFHWPRSG